MNSILSSLNTTSGKLKNLNSQYKNGTLTKEQYKDAASPLQNAMAGDIASGAIAGLGGLTNIIGTSMNMAQIGDTSQYDDAIADIKNIGQSNYTDFGQLSSDYARLSSPNFDYDTIRGGSTAERIGGVGSSMLSGASAGLTIGGPWGAAAGALVGLGAGIGGWLAGDANAKTRMESLQVDAAIAQDDARRNLAAAGERMSEYNFRDGVSNVRKNGGNISRKQSIEDFAARVMKRPKVREGSPSVVIRQHCKGGTMVRIKR